MEQSQSCVSKIDLLIQRLYEDNVEGKVSDEQFIKMSSAYEQEQKSLTQHINEQNKVTNTNSFLNLVKEYINITKLDAEIIRTFIERVYIYNVDTTDGRKTKKIKFLFNFIGKINLPTENKQ